jgi:hypothetical protein
MLSRQGTTFLTAVWASEKAVSFFRFSKVDSFIPFLFNLMWNEHLKPSSTRYLGGQIPGGGS